MKEPTLIKKITPEIHGIIWLTQMPIIEVPKGFQELDYLCNGQLTKLISALEKQEQNKDAQLIETKQFGQQFFIAHASTKNRDENQVIDVFSQILKLKDSALKKRSMNQEDQSWPQILIKNETSIPLKEKLSSLFKGVEFQS